VGSPYLRSGQERAIKINVNLLSKPEVDWKSGLEPDDVPTSLRWMSRESGEEVINIVKAATVRQYEAALQDANQMIKRWTGKKHEIRKDQGSTMKGKLEEILVNTLYKKKGVKIHPRDDVPSDGSTPDGDPEWKEKKWKKVKEKLQEDSKYREWITPKFSDIEKGARIKGERLQGLIDQVKDTLTPEELDVFLEIMYNREAALAWEFSECGKLDPLVAPPQVIRVVEHKAWQARSIPIPKGCEKDVIKLLRTRLERGILEEGHGPYRNPFFLVQKKDGQFRLINSATLMNKHTIRDSLIPPGCDEFSADFAMCKMLSLLDFFSGYDQMELAEVSRDLTSFMTPIGLLRMCTLPQGATNSVAQFTRNILRILRDLIPDACRSFLDDICVRGPTTEYGGEEAAPGIRRFVLEHLVNLDKVLVNIELSGCTVAGQKSQFCKKTAVVTGYLCGTYGRSPEEKKVVKILEWEVCLDVGEVRSFLGIVGYYRQWIKWFAWIAKSLTDLLKKDAEFVWGPDQKEAMETLKRKITSPPILITLNYSEEAGEVILMVDASLLGWGCVLMQLIDGKRKPIRFESGLWNSAETKYDATKRECRAVLYAFRRLRSMIYGIPFVLETDSQVLVHQINGKADDVPGSLVLRWISYLLLFDFTVRHVPGKKNRVADGLSRKHAGPSDQMDAQVEGDIEEFVDLHLNTVQVNGEPEILDGTYSQEHKDIAKYLCTFEKPEGLTRSQLQWFKRKALSFFVQGRRLWKRAKRDYDSPLLVVDDPEIQKHLIKNYHFDSGHKGREVTYNLVKRRYFWNGMWNQIAEAVRCCPTCQAHAPWRPVERVQHTQPFDPMVKVHFDCQYMPMDQGFKYLAEARCDMTGWVEAIPLKKISALALKRFATNLIYRFGMISAAVVDGGPEFKKEFPPILKELGILLITISPYNAKANGVNERGHYSIAMALKKMEKDGKPRWYNNLERALFADRTAAKAPHGHSPFYLIHGWEPAYPLEVEVPTWRLINWDEVSTAEDLILARIRVLERKNADVAAAREKIAAFRAKAAKRQNEKNIHRLRKTPLKEGDLVLKFDVPRSNDMSTTAKMARKWYGPFRILKHHDGANHYRLQTLDGYEITKSIHGDQLKKFEKDENGWWEGEQDEKEAFKEFQKGKVAPEEEEGQENTRITRSMRAALDQTIDQESDEENEDEDSGEEDLGEKSELLYPRRQTPVRIEIQLPGLTAEQAAQYESY
jgi:ribonuclease HI